MSARPSTAGADAAQGAKPSVSVIVPTFQRRELVTRAVRSILAQTYEDFEVVVVDDGSDDGTREQLTGIDPRVRYQWQENRGVSAARNTGIRLARGEIVTFLDSDNRWLPHHLAVVIEALRRNPEAVLATTSPWMRARGRQKVEAAQVVDALPSLLVTLGVFTFVSCVAVRRSTLDAVGGFDERLVTGENGELWLRLAALGPFCVVERKTMVHRETRGSLKDRAGQSGEELRAFDIFVESARTVVDGLQRPDRDQLATGVRGLLHYVAALHALRTHDDVAAAAGFADGARLFPALSRHPEAVSRRLVRTSWTPPERLHYFTVAANAWPDQTSQTALFLRARAIAMALGGRKPGAALALLRRWPLRATPTFVVRAVPVAVDVAHRHLHDVLRGGPESPDLEEAAGGPASAEEASVGPDRPSAG